MSTYINYGLWRMHYLLEELKRHARLLDAIKTSRNTQRDGQTHRDLQREILAKGVLRKGKEMSTSLFFPISVLLPLCSLVPSSSHPSLLSLLCKEWGSFQPCFTQFVQPLILWVIFPSFVLHFHSPILILPFMPHLCHFYSFLRPFLIACAHCDLQLSTYPPLLFYVPFYLFPSSFLYLHLPLLFCSSQCAAKFLSFWVSSVILSPNAFLIFLWVII